MENHITFGNARFTVITESVIRMEYSAKQRFTEEQTLFAVNREHNGCQFDMQIKENQLIIKTDKITLSYMNDELEFHKGNLTADIDGVQWCFGDISTGNLGGTLVTLDGIGEKVPVDDGLLSRDGWYVIEDSGKAVLRDGWISKNPNAQNQDFYLFGYGNDYKGAMKAFTYISGKAELPRRYVFGSWYSRWWKYTDKELLSIVQEYDEHDFPLDIMVIDMDWHYHDWVLNPNNEEDNKHRETYGYSHAGNMGWTGYSWNRKLIPEPEKLLKEFHDRQIYVTLNDHPADGVRVHEEWYEGFMTAIGVDPKSQINLEYDAGDKRYMTAMFDSVHSKIEQQGVDFWWLDWQQDEIKPYIKGIYGLRHLPWLNKYYYEHSRKDGKRGQSFSRWGGFGDQKHPVYFSGDAESTWEMLKFEVEFNQTSSNAGCFYWGHDTGGFFGERNAEMYIRWTQFAALSACLRVHSQRDKALDRRPWTWGEEAENAMRKAAHLRSMLIPYIYSCAYQAYEESIPLIRAMYFDYPNEKKAYENMQQFLFGDAILAAPITEPMDKDGKAQQKVWIYGGDYYDYFTGKKYEDGFEGNISCGLEEFPMLLKGGTPIPMQEYTKRMTSTPLEKLIVLCYPGEYGSFTLYEDDGITEKFKNGSWLKTELSYCNEDGRITIEIVPKGQGYEGMPTEREYVIYLPNTDAGLKLISDEIDVKLEHQEQVTVIRIPKREIMSSVKIELA